VTDGKRVGVSRSGVPPARVGFDRDEKEWGLKRSATWTFGLAVALGSVAVAQEPPVSASQASTPYVVGLTDVLRVNVWREPDLSLEAAVRLDGMITLPLLGDVPAAGRAPSQIAESIAKGIERFVENPRVTVAVAKATSARVYVLGRIARPGEFPLSGRMTVLQALALAGGLTDFAKEDSIAIVRDDQTVVPVNYKRIVDGKDISQNVLLVAGDTVVVP
jgi:polysaccharide export outer membrane protein